MQLRLQPRNSKNLLARRLINLLRSKLIIKIILFLSIFSLAIFFLDKIEIGAPGELIKQEISNDKLITLK